MAINITDHIARSTGQKKRYEGANVKMFMDLVEDQMASEKEGRPIFKEIPTISVQWPGGDETCRRIEDRDKEEFPEKYAAFIAGREAPIEGTALTQWPIITRSAAEELKYFKIYTVEQLATITDEVKRKIGPLAPWIKKAKDWVKAVDSDQAKVVKMESQIETLERRNKKLEEQVQMLIMRIEATEGTRLSDVAA